MIRAGLIAGVLLTGCAGVRPAPTVRVVQTACPVPQRVVIVHQVAPSPSPPVSAEMELKSANDSALQLMQRPDLPTDVIATITQRTRDATAAVDKLERRQRYRLANPADRKAAREAVGSLDDYLHEHGAD